MTATKIRPEVGLRAATVTIAITLLVAANDAHGASRMAREGNSAPTITGAPAAFVTAGQTYRFTPVVSDDDGPDLSFRIRNKPSWATFDAATGALTGEPRNSDIGTYSRIQILASDSIESAVLPEFSIDVVAPAQSVANSAPSISGVPATTATTGQIYAFAPTASDSDGDRLTFSATNVPAWAYLDTSTGKLYGTPGATAVGIYGNIVISVSDGTASASLPSFSIDVVAADNVAPRISGTPPDTVTVGQLYSFRPTATDADGDALTFAIRNKPAWASFDARSGALTGTPSTAAEGSYANIDIGVSDGTAAAELPAFDVTVMPEQSGSVTLTWQPPQTNTDGTPADDLSGYEVSYGTGSGQYTQSVPVMDPALTSVTIEQLEPATWYFAVRALTSTGNQSEYSGEVSKLVR